MCFPVHIAPIAVAETFPCSEYQEPSLGPTWSNIRHYVDRIVGIAMWAAPPAACRQCLCVGQKGASTYSAANATLSRQLQSASWNSAHRSRLWMSTCPGCNGAVSYAIACMGSEEVGLTTNLAMFGTKKGYSSAHLRCLQIGSACVMVCPISYRVRGVAVWLGPR